MVDPEEPMEVEEGTLDDAIPWCPPVPMEDEDVKMNAGLFDISKVAVDHAVEDTGKVSALVQFLHDDDKLGVFVDSNMSNEAMNTDPGGYYSEYPLSLDDLRFSEHELARGVSQVHFRRGYYVGYNRAVYHTAVVKRLDASHRQEVEIIKKLQHPYTISFLDYIEVPNIVYLLVLEFADLGSLADVLKKHLDNGVLLPGDVISRWCYQLCDAVKYLHSKFILHRDIKSGNCMICSPNILKLGDFGLSRETGGFVSHISTSVGRGTHRWMAPEVITKHHHSTSSDVYSMSMVFQELYTCKVPFSHIVISVTVSYHVVNNNLRPDISSDAPEYLKGILPQCWTSDVHKRPKVPEIMGVIVDAMPPEVRRELLNNH